MSFFDSVRKALSNLFASFRSMFRKAERAYGYIADLFDPRDFVYNKKPTAPLPFSLDLRPKCPPVLDQGSLGSCTANSLANAHLFAQMQQPGGIDSVPSRLWIYLQERIIEGTVNQDAGAQIRDGIKVLASMGAPPESDWPYVISKFKQDVTAKFKDTALKHKVLSYHRVPQNLDSIKTALANELHPISFGFLVYDSFETTAVAKTGVVPMPTAKEKCLGGHAVLIVGYDDAKQSFIVMNSWGTGWGDKGYFYLPYTYVTNSKLASDFWLIKVVKE